MRMGDGMGKLIGDRALCDFISVTSPFQAGLSSEQVAMRNVCHEALVRAGVDLLSSKHLQHDLWLLYTNCVWP